MTRYAIIDTANLFYRARHVVRGDAYTKAGMALTIVFRSLRKLHREFKVDHMVFCTEGHSWRYKVYPQYKGKRKLDRMNMSPSEKEEDEAFNQVMDDFIAYMAEKTRCTVLHSPGIEGDDFVARWIQLHANDEHIILSGDSDFVQLLAPNVSIYNGIDNRLFTPDGVFNERGKPMVFHVNGKDGKIKVVGTIEECREKHEKEQREKQKKHNAQEKERQAAWTLAEKNKKLDDPEYKPRLYVPDPYEWEDFSFEPEAEWWRKALFVKIIRGDTGDGIFSAYPGVRYTSAKIGICEAWDDRNTQSYRWNNLMLQTWEKLMGTDKDGNSLVKQVRVLDEYKFNESLIDLTKQPEEIKELMDTVIVQAVQKQPIGNVGIHFLRFCDKNYLPALAKEANDHAAYLNQSYA